MTDTKHEHPQHNGPHAQQPAPERNFTDPVCGMSTDREGEFTRFDYQGVPYYFCSEHCQQKFRNDPGSYGVAPETAAPQERATYIDPVCGMSTDDANAFTRYTREGADYYFCSGHCLEKFKKNPDEFLKEITGQPPEHKEKKQDINRQYTCPMHPEVVRDKPGSCPKCGDGA